MYENLADVEKLGWIHLLEDVKLVGLIEHALDVDLVFRDRLAAIERSPCPSSRLNRSIMSKFDSIYFGWELIIWSMRSSSLWHVSYIIF